MPHSSNRSELITEHLVLFCTVHNTKKTYNPKHFKFLFLIIFTNYPISLKIQIPIFLSFITNKAFSLLETSFMIGIWLSTNIFKVF